MDLFNLKNCILINYYYLLVIQGLADMFCGQQTNFSLVSKGAECIVVNKKFYMENITESLQRFLRRQVCFDS